MNRLKLMRQADSAEDVVNTPGQTTEQEQTTEQLTEQNVDQEQSEEQSEEKPDEKELQIAVDLLKRVGNSANDIKDAYYSLLDNLNALNSSYQNVYNEFKQIVKLPEQKDITDVVQFQKDIEDAVKYLSDPNFLNGFMR